VNINQTIWNSRLWWQWRKPDAVVWHQSERD